MTKVLFVDRDGTLIEEPPDEQVDSIEKIRFMPGVFAALRLAQRAGYQLAMVTNQDGLGSDSFPQKRFDVPHEFMLDAFSSQGVEFDAVFVCPHRKADGCDCRKPRPGMLVRAAREHGIDLSRSFMVGDRWGDVEAGRAAGCRTFLVDLPYSQGHRCTPDARVADLPEAAAQILQALGELPDRRERPR